MDKDSGEMRVIIDETHGKMIEIPPIYYKITKETLDYGGDNYIMRIYNKMLALFDRYVRGRYKTTRNYSPISLKGYSLHPAFNKNNEKIDNLYIGEYQNDISNRRFQRVE